MTRLGSFSSIKLAKGARTTGQILVLVSAGLVLVADDVGFLISYCSGLEGDYVIETDCPEAITSHGRVHIERQSDTGRHADTAYDYGQCIVVDGLDFGLPEELLNEYNPDRLEGEVNGHLRKCKWAWFAETVVFKCTEDGEPVCSAILRPVE